MIKTTCICDICGAQIASQSKVAKLEVSKVNSNVDKDMMDLCADCRNDLMVWLQSKKKAASNK